jgi:hypothetical protein
MRIWSVHPKYLDTKGLVAVWRETLLAKHVLEGKTKGYRHHPQLHRFQKLKNPVAAINQYLSSIYSEGAARGYNFNKEKVDWNFKKIKITVTNGQMEYEISHLKMKLKLRDIKKYKQLLVQSHYEMHPMFRLVEGEIEEWEIR